MVQFREHWAHSVETQAAGVVRGRDELAADGVHLREGAYFPRIAVVVRKDSARKARAAGRLSTYYLLGANYLISGFAAQYFTEERCRKASEVGAAARAAYEYVGPDAVLVQGRLGLKAYNSLMQKHLIEH